VIGLTAGELASMGTLLLTDTATLESPDRNQSDGWADVATGVACRLVDTPAAERSAAGGLLNVQAPRVYFARTQTLAVDWRITVTSQSNRRITIDSIVVPHEGPFQYAVARGTR
jgi:hypothetical protein